MADWSPGFGLKESERIVAEMQQIPDWLLFTLGVLCVWFCMRDFWPA